MQSATHFDQTLRRSSALLAVVALLLQLLLPGIARAANGDWIEICSESGPVLIQVDAEPGSSDAVCPKCKDCVLCAAAVPGVSTSQTWLMLALPATRSLSLTDVEFSLAETRFQRPLTRGPPMNDTPNIGGASWI